MWYSPAGMNDARILFCRCANTDLLGSESRETLSAAIRALPKGRACEVDDLCLLAEQRDDRLAEFADQGGPSVVIACHARTVRALFEFAGSPLPAETTILNLRGADMRQACAILHQLELHSACKSTPSAPSPAAWPPWYPVIDSARCIQCKKCLGFCLFGVYELVEGKVRVARPRACKNNCPACARVCPQLAILFPKCKDSPINGADISPQDLARKDLAVDVEAISKSPDLYAELRKRVAEQTDGGK